jgi:hypothetical protein
MSAPEIVIEKAIDKRRHGRIKEGKILSIEMTKSCARDLTDRRIKAAVDDLADMLYRAHEGRAWAALGYQSWKEYCTAEFQMSERHSYRLLDFVEIKNVLADQLVSPRSESQVRALVSIEPRQQIEVWAHAVEIADGEQPTAKQVERAAVEIVPSKKSRGDCRPAIALDIADSVILRLDTILDIDKELQEAMHKIIAYCQTRIPGGRTYER